MEPELIKEVDNDLEKEQLEGVLFVFRVICSSDTSTLTGVCLHLIHNDVSPQESILLLALVLKKTGHNQPALRLVSKISHPRDCDSLTFDMFEEAVGKEEYERMRLRCFIVSLCKNLGTALCKRFYDSLCLMCKGLGQKYRDSAGYQIFEYLENCECIHSCDSEGVGFFLKALTTAKDYAKALSFTKRFILESEWPPIIRKIIIYF